MITSDQRKQIERMAYDAIKALYGTQEKLILNAYYDVIFNKDGEVISGDFEIKVETDSFYEERYYSFQLDNCTEIVSLRKGVLNAEFT